MRAVKFREATGELSKPEEMTDEDCGPLPVWRDGRVCLSCWKGSLWDRIKFLLTGRMWLWVHGGGSQPPVCLETKSPFVYAKEGD
jgi:hypothetical protein